MRTAFSFESFFNWIVWVYFSIKQCEVLFGSVNSQIIASIDFYFQLMWNHSQRFMNFFIFLSPIDIELILNNKWKIVFIGMRSQLAMLHKVHDEKLCSWFLVGNLKISMSHTLYNSTERRSVSTRLCIVHFTYLFQWPFTVRDKKNSWKRKKMQKQHSSEHLDAEKSFHGRSNNNNLFGTHSVDVPQWVSVSWKSCSLYATSVVRLIARAHTLTHKVACK